jgi:tetratricopeptide (TPR) repeat protein
VAEDSSITADFFISYATPDESAAREIGTILEGAGYTYVAQFRDFMVGTNFVREMQRGLAGSSRLIALLSPAYEASDNCQAEWSAAYAQDPGSRHGKIIPFKIADVEPNPLARQIVYKSLIGLAPEERAALVLAAIEPWMTGRKRTSPDVPRGSHSAIAGSGRSRPSGAKPGNLPGTIQHLFKGRGEFLQKLRESFQHNDAAAITGKAVHGLGGVGKTRTAIEYGHAYAKDYSATFFLIGKSESDLQDSLAALVDAAVLDLPEQDAPDLGARAAAVIRWLRANPGWLIIIDNVDDEPAARAARTFLDQIGGGGHVLITSRVGDWGHMVEPLELDLLSVEAAKDLLRESTPRRTRRADEDSALTRLADEQLGCLSLALVQAAAYIDERHIGFAEYSRLFEKEAKNLLAKFGEAAVRNLGYPRPVALTWQASLAQLSEAGRLLLDMLSWLSIEPIPRSLFDVWPQAETIDLEEALAELTRYSLVHWEAENSAITVHRLVAQVTRDNVDPAGRDRALEMLFPWLYAVNPEMNASDVRCWPLLLPLLPHAFSLFERTRNFGPYTKQANLYDEYATLLRSHARYSDAETLYRQALAMEEARYGPDDHRIAIRLNNLSVLLSSTNRMAEAEPFLRRALALSEAHYGPDHPIVAIRLNNLALLLATTNRSVEAEPLLRRALAIDEASFGSEDDHVATDLNNLAQLLADTNRLAEAEPLHRRALALAEASYGHDHPTVATRLNNLGLLLQATDRFEEAEEFHRRALAIDEASYGPDHPDVSIDLNNLAQLLTATDRLPDAEPLYRRALAISEASLGPNHPDVATTLNNLAGLLRSTGRQVEAQTLQRRAAEILLQSGKASGHLLPNTSSALVAYASMLIEAGRKPAEVADTVNSLISEVGFDPAEVWPSLFSEDD